MGLCATKNTIENDEDVYDEIDEDFIIESMSHVDDYTHVKYETQQDMLDRFDFENAKVLSEGENTDVYYVKYKNFQEIFYLPISIFPGAPMLRFRSVSAAFAWLGQRRHR